MKIKLQQVLEIMTELKKMENIEASPEFSYAAMKNLSLVEKKTEIMKNLALQPIEGGEQYRNERQKIIQQYVSKDGRGNLQTERMPNGQNNYKFTDENQDKFLKEIDLLDSTFFQYIKDVKDRQKNLDKLAEEEIDIEFTKVKLNQFPNKITPRQMKVLTPMLDEGKNDK